MTVFLHAHYPRGLTALSCGETDRLHVAGRRKSRGSPQELYYLFLSFSAKNRDDFILIYRHISEGFFSTQNMTAEKCQLLLNKFIPCVDPVTSANHSDEALASSQLKCSGLHPKYFGFQPKNNNVQF